MTPWAPVLTTSGLVLAATTDHADLCNGPCNTSTTVLRSSSVLIGVLNISIEDRLSTPYLSIR